MNKLAIPEGNLVRQTDHFLDTVASSTSIHQFMLFPLAEPESYHVGVSKLAIGAFAGVLLAGVPLSPTNASFEAPTQVTAEAPSSNPSLVVVGDSLTVERKNGAMQSKFASYGIDVLDIEAKTGVPASYGQRELDAAAPFIKSADMVVIALGTNPSSNYQAELLQDVEKADALGSSGTKRLLIGIPELMGDSKVVDALTRNPGISSVVDQAKAEGINAVMLPYYDFGKTIDFDKAHVHPSHPDELVAHDLAVIAPLVTAQHALLYPQESPPTNPVNTGPELPPIVISPNNIPSQNGDMGSSGAHAPSVKKGFLLDLSSIGTHTSLPSIAEYTQVLVPLKPKASVLIDIGYKPKLQIPVPPLERPSAPAVVPPTESSPQSPSDTSVNNTVPVPVVPAAEVAPQPVLVDIQPVFVPPSVPGSTTGETTPIQPPFKLPTIEVITANDKPADSVVPAISTKKLPAPPTDTKPITESGDTLPATTPEAATKLSTLYTIDSNNVLDDSQLRQLIRNGGLGFRKAQKSDTFPAGDYYRIPDTITGEPYIFSTGTTYNERFGSEKTSVIALLVMDKVSQLQLKYPDLQPVTLMDITSTHIEHRNGGDIDVGLLNNPEARKELFLWLISLRNPDSSSYIHHIISGDQGLVDAGNAYLQTLGYKHPSIIFGADHGQDPGPASHWHISGDGGATGPFDQPAANVPLNSGGEAPLEPVVTPSIPIPATTTPPDNTSPNSTQASPTSTIPPVLVDLPNIGITVSSLPKIGEIDKIITPSPPVTTTTSPAQPTTSVSEHPNPDSTPNVSGNPNQAPNTTTPSITPQDSNNQSNQPNVDPNVTASASPPNGSPTTTNVTVGGDVITDQVVQIMLPGATAENIGIETPLVINALNELGIGDTQMELYALATINVETSGFAPIPEIGKGHNKKYGEIDPETGQAYYGRGFIQLTWRSNYEAAGKALGLDLVHNPDLALDPNDAARILAWYLKAHEGGIRNDLNNKDYKAARQIVNGPKANGLDGFTKSYLAGLTAIGG